MSDNSVIEIVKKFDFRDNSVHSQLITRELGFIVDEQGVLYAFFPETTGFAFIDWKPENFYIYDSGIDGATRYSLCMSVVNKDGDENKVLTLFRQSFLKDVQGLSFQLNDWVLELAKKGVWQLLQKIHEPDSVDKLRKLYTK